MTARRMLGAVLVSVGVTLLAISAHGVFFDPYDRPPGADGYAATIDRIDYSVADAPEVNYQTLAEITSAYADGIEYKWPEERAQVALTDNWIMHLMAYLDRPLNALGLTNVENLFSAYESISYKRALGRGFGICSQNSLGLVSLLDRRYGIESDVITLGGHVVVESGGYLLDPSIGLSFPFPLSEAEKREENNGAISAAYTDHLARYGKLGATYNSSGNVRTDGVREYRSKIYWLERASLYLKWLVPAMLVLLGGWLLTGNRASNTTAAH